MGEQKTEKGAYFTREIFKNLCCKPISAYDKKVKNCLFVFLPSTFSGKTADLNPFQSACFPLKPL
jgi:hypothetical protein